MKMNSLKRVGVGLSLVFICLLLALIAEIYYLLWWKRRIIQREIEANYPKPRRELSLCYFFCCKQQVDSSSLNTQIHHQPSDDQEFQFHPQNNNKDFTVSSMEENNGGFGTELFLAGPPRFLFTINEESREDLESEDGKPAIITEKKRNSLNDLFSSSSNNNGEYNHDTPTYITPVSSPPVTPVGSCHSSQSGGGYNPFYESSNDAEFSRIVKCSPPPKFKFLRDAEEKLQRRIMLMGEQKMSAYNVATTTTTNNNSNSNSNGNGNGNLLDKCEEDGSFIRIIVAKNKEIVDNVSSNHHHYHSPRFYSGDSSSSSSHVPSSSSSSNRKFESFLIL